MIVQMKDKIHPNELWYSILNVSLDFKYLILFLTFSSVVFNFATCFFSANKAWNMWNIFVHACLFCPWFLFRTYSNLALLCLSLQHLLLHLLLKLSLSSILNLWLLFIFLLIFLQIMMKSVILDANNTEWQFPS